MSEPAGSQPQTKTERSFRVARTASVLILTLALCGLGAATTDTFLTWRNLVVSLLTNASCLGIIACGMTFVMIAGGFDLSVPSITAVCCVLTVLLLQVMGAFSPWVAIPLALLGTALAGGLLGATNGVLVSYVGVNPFVVTLSTALVFRGLALIITRGGQSVQIPLNLKETYSNIYWGQVGSFGSHAQGIMVPILIFLVVFVACIYLLRYTRFGHYVYAVGGNENASWLAGINTPRVKAATYVLSGLSCAAAAAIYCAITGTAQANSYQGLEMMAIASVIVGGTPLGGGRGSLFCTLNGLLLLSVIESLLSHYGVNEEYRNVVRGIIILVVVAVDLLVRGGQKQRR